MNTQLFLANERGFADHGWLKANHSFSFANYHDPKKINFGALRVLNDDVIAPKMGFGTHPHDNMEIVTLIFKGELQHKDSMGNQEIIHQGHLQVMSAGSGIQHSEFNTSPNVATNLFQLWLFPKEKNIAPRYQIASMDFENTSNDFVPLVGPQNNNFCKTWINQDAYIHYANFSEGTTKNYTLKNNQHGVYAMLISGSALIENQTLNERDALALWDCENISIKALSPLLKIVLIEVPLQF